MTLTSGPYPADVLVVGGAPSFKDRKAQLPFQGNSGKELSNMLNEAGLIRTECRICYVTSVVPPQGKLEAFFPTKKKDLKGNEAWINEKYCTSEIQQGLMELQREIARTKPKVIIALGEAALWALTGESGITKWRGSILKHECGAWIIPTYEPAQILKVWAWRFIAVHDFRKAYLQLHEPFYESEWNFIIEPTYVEVMQVLYARLADLHQSKNVHLSVDIETRCGHIDCVGIAWSDTDAISIPFCTYAGGHYFSLAEEMGIIIMLKKLLLHPNARVSGQNFLYDAMYFAKSYGWYPTPFFDTMIAQGVLFPGMQKSLDFLSSIYLDFHQYWKDENKTANTKVDDKVRWRYNCKDCCATFSLVKPLDTSLDKEDLVWQYNFELKLFDPLMVMMMRGVRVNETLRSEYALTLLDAQAQYQQYFQNISRGVWYREELVKSKTASAWYDSPSQQKKIFYEFLGMDVVRNRKTKRPTVDDSALKTFPRKEPLLMKLCSSLLTYRSIGVFYSTFITANLDKDGRARTSYNPVGTETLRFSSSIDAFGKGLNLQNISAGDDS